MLRLVKEERNVLHTIKGRLTGLATSCVIEGKIAGRIEVARRRERRCKRLLGDIKEKSGYWKLKMEALDHILWRTGFGRVHGAVVSTDMSA